MFFVKDETKNIRNSTIRLNRGREECRAEEVYIADGIRDKLTPLEVEMKYNIRQASTAYTTSTVSRRRRAALEPVLDENRGTVQRDSMNIAKNCGEDNICIPALSLKVKSIDEYVLGTNDLLSVEVSIVNKGEDAFETSFYMNVPPGLDYKKTKRIGDNREFTCSPPTFANNNTLKCDIGNPMPGRNSQNQQNVVKFNVLLEPSKKGSKDINVLPMYDFFMEVNSTNEEADGGQFDNIVKKSIGISVKADLSITGSSSPPDFHYNVTHYKQFNSNLTRNEAYSAETMKINEAEIGPQVVHVYEIRNSGTSKIEEIEVFIKWPAETLDGEPLMYLMNQPEVLGNIRCDPSQHVNTANIQSDRILDRKSYLDKTRAPVRQGDSGFSSSRNAQDSVTADERRLLDQSESAETGGHSESWRQQSSSSYNAGRASGASRGGSQFESNQRAVNSGSAGGRGSTLDWNIEKVQDGGVVSSGSQRGSSQGSFSGSRSSQFDSDRSGQRGGFGGGGGSNAREYEVHETWNSTSVNGGPAVTNYASRNRETVRGQVVSESSTERVIQGGFGGSRYESSSHYDQSSGVSQSEYERKREEYMEQQRRQQEEQRIRQQEERTRRLEQQRREEQERIRLDEERQSLEEERRRLSTQSTRSSSTSGQGVSESSYNRQSETRFSSGSSGGSSSGSR